MVDIVQVLHHESEEELRLSEPLRFANPFVPYGLLDVPREIWGLILNDLPHTCPYPFI